MLVKAEDMENRNVLLCKYEESDIRDMLTWQMTRVQEIEGVLQLEGNVGEAQWKYDISGLKELKVYLQEERTKEEICNLLKNIADTMEIVEQYLIPDSRLALGLSQIYVDEDGYTYMMCCPVEMEGMKLRNFVKELSEDIRPKAGMTSQYLNRLKTFSIQQIECNKEDLTSLYKELEMMQEVEIPLPPTPTIPSGVPVPPLPPNVQDETVVWNNVRGMLVRQRTGERFMLSRPEMQIGKDSMNVEIFVSDNATISRRHAKVINRNEKYYICDCNSTNHTYLNGQMLQPNEEKEVVSGNVIRLSNEEFLFMIV